MRRTVTTISGVAVRAAGTDVRAVIFLCLLLLLIGCSKREEPNLLAPGAETSNIWELPLEPPPEKHIDDLLKKLLISKSQGQGLSFFMLPDDLDYAAFPADPLNPINAAKIQLGMYLFQETSLAINNVRPEGFQTYSCGSCHPTHASFFSNLAQGIGEGGTGFGTAGEARVVDSAYDFSGGNIPDITDLRPPTVLNSGYQEAVMWDGKFGGTGVNLGTESSWTGDPAANYMGWEGVETQAFVAQNTHRLHEDGVADTTYIVPQGNIEYTAQFFVAFQPAPFDMNRENIAKAIAAYERTIVANQSPFQQWLRGNMNAMSYAEKRGAFIFFGGGGCVDCHTGPALNSMTFHALGFNDLDGSWDPGAVDLTRFGGTIATSVRKGRGGFTGNAADDYKFKTPQLYNLRENQWLGHGSSFRTVREVIEYKARAIKQNAMVPDGQLADEFVPLGFDERSINALTTFVEDALYDGGLFRYHAFHMPSLNCFPNQDPQSLIDQPSFCLPPPLRFDPDEPKKPARLPRPAGIASH